MTDVLDAKKGERSAARLGLPQRPLRSHLVTRVGKRDLRVPQDRHGRRGCSLRARVAKAGVIRSQAVPLAIGIGWDGWRSILAVEPRQP